jgi:hypothetical protein
VFMNGSSLSFKPTLVNRGTFPEGSTWAMNPLPGGDAGPGFPAPCQGRTPVRGPSAFGKWGQNPTECSGNWPTTLYIEDTIRIPKSIEAGEYVLGWEWGL